MKDEFSCSNLDILKVHEDIRHHHEFGSLFQFWVSQILRELEGSFEFDLDDLSKGVDNKVSWKDLQNLAIKIAKRIGQDN
jgi:hypothetical protein